MPRGGKREGAGAKPKWKHGKTTSIRVPEVLVEDVLKAARRLDEGESLEFDTNSKVIDFSRVLVGEFRGKRFVFLEKLMRAGYEILPLTLAENVRREVLGGGK